MKDLKEAIMQQVLVDAQHKKARKRREKAIILSYVAAICFVLLLLFFLKGQHIVSPKLKLPGLAEPGSEDIIIYLKLFGLSIVFSLIAFMVYFFSSRNSKKEYPAQSRST